MGTKHNKKICPDNVHTEYIWQKEKKATYLTSEFSKAMLFMNKTFFR